VHLDLRGQLAHRARVVDHPGMDGLHARPGIAVCVRGHRVLPRREHVRRLERAVAVEVAVDARDVAVGVGA
jgi:hypothetical protein